MDKKEGCSVKIAVDTSELDTAIKKIKEASYRAERLSNALKETKNLITYIFPPKSEPTESEQEKIYNKELKLIKVNEMDKKALFNNALSVEKAYLKFIEFQNQYANDTVYIPQAEQELTDNVLKISKSLYEMYTTYFNEIKSRGLIEEYFDFSR